MILHTDMQVKRLLTFFSFQAIQHSYDVIKTRNLLNVERYDAYIVIFQQNNEWSLVLKGDNVDVNGTGWLKWKDHVAFHL